MASKSKRLSKKHFEAFKKYCKYWQKKLGLESWDLAFYEDTKKDLRAGVGYDHSGRMVSVYFSMLKENWGGKATMFDLRETALHEMLHLLIAEVGGYARAHNAKHLVDEGEHRIINTLIPLIYGRKKKNRKPNKSKQAKKRKVQAPRTKGKEQDPKAENVSQLVAQKVCKAWNRWTKA